jgi:hypothetical protein
LALADELSANANDSCTDDEFDACAGVTATLAKLGKEGLDDFLSALEEEGRWGKVAVGRKVAGRKESARR